MVIRCHVPKFTGDAPSDYVAGVKWLVSLTHRYLPDVQVYFGEYYPTWNKGLYYYYEVEEVEAAPLITDAERAKRCIEDYNYLKDQGWTAHGQKWEGARLTVGTPAFRLVKFSKTTVTEIP